MRTLLGIATFAALAAAQPSISAVVNAGSNDARFCPALLVTITGINFGDNASLVSVIAAGQPAGIIDVANNVIHAQLPLSLSNVTTTLSVNVNGVPSNSYPLTVDTFAPAFYGSSPITPVAAPGQAVTATLVGLGLTNPLIPIGTVASTPVPTAATPVVTVGGLTANVISSAASTTAAGVYQVTFSMPNGFAIGSVQNVSLSIGGKTAPLTTITAGAGQPIVTGVVNAGSPSAGLSPGVLANVEGQFLSPTGVMIGGRTAPILQSSSNGALIQIPVELPIGATTLTLTNSGGKVNGPIDVNLGGYAPAFYGEFQTPAGISIGPSNPAMPGTVVIGHLVGLGPTIPPIATGQVAGSQASTAATPMLYVNGKQTPFSYCGLEPQTIGVYRLSFTVPADVALGSVPVTLAIGGQTTPMANLATTTALPVTIGLRNAASGVLIDALHGIAPNMFLSIYASNIGTADSQVNLFPATQFQGTGVTFDGVPVPLYNVIPSANLINLVSPPSLGGTGTTSVQVSNNIGGGQTVVAAQALSNVGVFRIADPSNPNRQAAAATVANTAWQILPASTAAAYHFAPCPSASPATPCAGPAHAGDSIVLYFTGGGLATPNGDPAGKPVPIGSVAPADGSVVYKTVVTPTLTIGGISAPVLFSGIAPGTAAEYQINTTIPQAVAPGDDVPVVLTFGASSDMVTIAVK